MSCFNAGKKTLDFFFVFWNVPHVPNLTDNGTADASAPFQLTEAGQNFTATVGVGNVVALTADTSITAKVLSVDSDTQLTLSANIIPPAGGGYTIDGPIKNMLPVTDISTTYPTT